MSHGRMRKRAAKRGAEALAPHLRAAHEPWRVAAPWMDEESLFPLGLFGVPESALSGDVHATATELGVVRSNTSTPRQLPDGTRA